MKYCDFDTSAQLLKSLKLLTLQTHLFGFFYSFWLIKESYFYVSFEFTQEKAYISKIPTYTIFFSLKILHL